MQLRRVVGNAEERPTSVTQPLWQGRGGTTKNLSALFFCFTFKLNTDYDTKETTIENPFRAFNLRSGYYLTTSNEIGEHARFSHFEKYYQKRLFL